MQKLMVLDKKDKRKGKFIVIVRDNCKSSYYYYSSEEVKAYYSETNKERALALQECTDSQSAL